MKYADLIRFDPIESVVQLREADQATSARRLVETYVISDRMAEQLTDLVFPHLQFDAPVDNKGLLVVGNYGTGKSHLMAVLSAVAEHRSLADALSHPAVADKAGGVAGRFIVVRAEINSSMPLRQFVMGTLQDRLAERGVSFDIPDETQIRNHKDLFASMMEAFTTTFPEHGLLFILDELLDYLRANREQELMHNLNFLRAVGEFTKGSRFRFIAGVQETLFDNPRFQFAADSLRRVQDRFEQMRIAREDVAHVAAERLLKKDAKQQALVREHLTRFAPLYGSMNERMDEFVRMFPVHPAYLDTFERVYFAEKREVLKTLSDAIRQMLQDEVPSTEPGVLAYDSYWKRLQGHPSFRSVPEILEVATKSADLEARIQQSLHARHKPLAIRLIHALSVHRLTTSDIYSPLGATAEELRDDLCLFKAGVAELGGDPAENLRTQVETALAEVLRTVSGQFLTRSQENSQYYLDLKKDIDFDALIEKRAESLSPEQLDRFYFDALRRVVLEDPDAPSFVSGYRIWEYELEWRERRAGRSGYLFLGAPNERSTAQPPRDYYLYFLQAYEPPAFRDERKDDEVFFRLKHRDPVFERAVKLYAAAREQAATAGPNKRIYEDKATAHLRALTQWFQENVRSAFDVTYHGTTASLGEVLQTSMFARAPERGGVRDFVDVAAAVKLSAHFSNIAPRYPTFSTTITRANREQAAQDALRWIAGAVKSKLGASVLDALDLLDGDRLRPRDSSFAAPILAQLGAKGEGQVVNRSELVQLREGVEYWSELRLEPEFLAVVLASLVHSGDLVVSLTGKRIDAGAVDQFAKLTVEDLVQFKHIERPRDLPLGALQELFDLLDLPKGLIVNPATRDDAVTQLQARVAGRVNDAVIAQARLGDLILWSSPILTDAEQADWRQRIGELKRFLESLQAFNTIGKLKNFPHDAAAIHAQRAGLVLLGEVDELTKLVHQLGPLTAYLGKAETLLPIDHPWAETARQTRGEWLAKATSPTHRADRDFHRALSHALTELRSGYQDVYLTAHGQMRLGATDDVRKGRLAQDPRLKQLQQLASVEMMPAQQLTDFQAALFGLKTCYSLSRPELDADPVCPHCGFRPVLEASSGPRAGDRIAKFDSELDLLIERWTATLLSNLADPMTAGNLQLLAPGAGRDAVATFLQVRSLPDPVTPAFVQALQEILSGLEKVAISEQRLRAALTDGGTPCTVGELRARFDGFVNSLTKGKDPTRVRVVVER